MSHHLPRTFYDRPTLTVAEDLLGKVLVHGVPGAETAGVVVEVEAYIGEEDPACHAAPGRTPRNLPLYGSPGYAYVYLNYGVHFLFNVVTEAEGHPAAVLVRALEPVEGLALMRQRRAAYGRARGTAPTPEREVPDCALCRGPGSLSRAMGITLADNRADLCGTRLYLEDRGLERPEIAWSSRIGISVGREHPWRAFVIGSKAVSGTRTPNR